MWPPTPLPIVSESFNEDGIGAGNIVEVLRDQLAEQAENMATSRLNTKDDIYDSIKAFFAKGR